MLIGGVVDDQIDEDADASVVGLVDQLDEVAERAQVGMDRVEVGDVVAVVPIRARMDGVQPDAGDTEPGQVVEPVDEARQVADPVPVGILVGVDVEAVDDSLTEPSFGHRHPLPADPLQDTAPRARPAKGKPAPGENEQPQPTQHVTDHQAAAGHSRGTVADDERGCSAAERSDQAH